VPTSRTRSAATRPAAPASRALPAVLLVLALAGLAVAVDLWILWHHAHAGGGPAFCDVSNRLSCSRVALSPYSAVLGVPVAAWGALAYLLVAALAGWALLRRPHPSFPAGLLLVLTGAMTAGAAGLAYVSEVIIGAFCYMCAGSWTASAALLGCTIALVRRAGGPAAALRADLASLRARRGPALGGAAIFAAATAGLLALYAAAPWRAPVAGADARGGAAAAPMIPPGPPGSLPVYEFSDYMCPHCATLHAAERAIVARRPDLRFLRRFYPLDSACNKLVTEPLPGHEHSCELARGGICAEQQGRFEAYDDAAFAAQRSSPTAEEVAVKVGLDMASFRDCLAAPETERRLAEDVDEGLRLGINGTPTLLVRGRVYTVDALPLLFGVDPVR
jgi:uncharacterized membrane protein